MNIEIYRAILYYLKMFRKQMQNKSPDKYGREKDYEHLTFLINILEKYIKNDSSFTNEYYDKIIGGTKGTNGY